jgi:rhamnosyl/mannosyltransferase
MHPLTERFLASLDSIIVTAPALIENTPALWRHREKCEVIPLGIDETRFASIDHDAVLDIRRQYGSPLLLYVGRLVYYKGCAVLIEAMRSAPNCNLVMVGSGPLHSELRELIKKEGLGNRIHLLGWQPDSVLKTLYQACDAFVLPSTLPTECFGLAQVEAMMCGKPVINTDLPTGVPWVSRHNETGLTVSAASCSELAKAINLLVSDSALRRQLGANAQKRAHELFTLKMHVSSTVRHYENLLVKAGRERLTVPSTTIAEIKRY